MCGGRIRENVLLKNYTTFHIGGRAAGLVEAYSAEELVSALARPRPLILGRGSNVLVSDSGYDGTVVVNRIGGIERTEEGVVAGAGVSLPALARKYAAEGLTGLEWAAGIPSSVGGAVFMNAGAFEGSVSGALVWCEALRGDKLVRLTREECDFSYRDSVFQRSDDIIVSACFKAAEGERDDIESKMAGYASFRRSTQPVGFSAGSIFRGAEKPAGWYIEQCGLKGMSVGGAEVSKKHANFIVNTGFATASDVAVLIRIIKAAVYDGFGVRLSEEIRYVGDF